MHPGHFPFRTAFLSLLYIKSIWLLEIISQDMPLFAICIPRIFAICIPIFIDILPPQQNIYSDKHGVSRKAHYRHMSNIDLYKFHAYTWNDIELFVNLATEKDYNSTLNIILLRFLFCATERLAACWSKSLTENIETVLMPLSQTRLDDRF